MYFSLPGFTSTVVCSCDLDFRKTHYSTPLKIHIILKTISITSCFRYMPKPKPNTMTFPVEGVNLVKEQSNCKTTHCKIKLRNLTREQSGGAYRCEISSEAPAFRLTSETHNITVAGKIVTLFKFY